jgi:hypothetical protein
MLLIFLLGAITKLLVVSADCDIGTTNYITTDWTNVSYSVTSLIVAKENVRKLNALTANASHSFIFAYEYSLQAHGTGCTTSPTNIMKIWIVL